MKQTVEVEVSSGKFTETWSTPPWREERTGMFTMPVSADSPNTILSAEQNIYTDEDVVVPATMLIEGLVFDYKGRKKYEDADLTSFRVLLPDETMSGCLTQAEAKDDKLIEQREDYIEAVKKVSEKEK
jgi:hypothetical protein